MDSTPLKATELTPSLNVTLIRDLAGLELLKDIIPPLSDEESSALEISLKAEGCRDALIVWGNILIDGHNRHTICKANSIPFKTTDKEFIDRDDAKLWIIDNQLGRRNLTPFVRAELHLKKKAILAAEARKKVVEVGKQTGRGNKKVYENSNKPLVTLKKIAKAADVSDNTVFRVEKIIAKAPAPVLEKLRRGEVSINEAYTSIKYAEKEAAREERREENREIIKKAESPAVIVGKVKFSTIVIDPPWDWGDEGDVNQLGRAKPDYATMSFDELLKLPVDKLSDKDCHLYLWITKQRSCYAATSLNPIPNADFARASRCLST